MRRRRRKPPFASTAIARRLVREARNGLEIGGPSPLFARRGQLAVYPVARRLDSCNFARETVWEGSLVEGRTFRFDPLRRRGRQLILEAADLRSIPSESYGVVLSSHTLEHTANPLGALDEWRRVLRPGGGLVLVAPHKEATFDHLRPVTALEHLLDDRRANRQEDDPTHLEEVLALHDLSRDRRAGERAAWEQRTRRFAENRAIHHHVFDTELVVRVVDLCGFELLAVEPVRPCHVVVVARKPEGDAPPDNAGFLGPRAAWRATSPFALDRS